MFYFKEHLFFFFYSIHQLTTDRVITCKDLDCSSLHTFLFLITSPRKKTQTDKKTGKKMKHLKAKDQVQDLKALLLGFINRPLAFKIICFWVHTMALRERERDPKDSIIIHEISACE
jgi:hypothetical protein